MISEAAAADAAPAPDVGDDGAFRSVRALLDDGVTLLVITVVLALLTVARPAALGGDLNFVFVVGSSMEPSMSSGDLAMTFRRDSYEVGDVIAYRVSNQGGHDDALVIHRIVGGTAETGYQTRGDNRDGNDLWRPTPDDVVGEAFMALPKGALVFEFVRSPAGLGLLAALVAFVFAAGAVRERAEEDEAEEPEGDEEGERAAVPGGGGDILPPASPRPLDADFSEPPAPGPPPTAEEVQRLGSALRPAPALAVRPGPDGGPSLGSGSLVPRTVADAGKNSSEAVEVDARDLSEPPLVTPRLLVLLAVCLLTGGIWAVLQVHHPWATPDAAAGSSAREAKAPDDAATAAPTPSPPADSATEHPRRRDFFVPGAPREPRGELPLPSRARMVAERLTDRHPTDANVRWWLYQHAWIVRGAQFGWHSGAEALQILIALDEDLQRRWGVGGRSEAVARSALADVLAARARGRGD